jgi:hypothetical protein
MSDLSYLDTRDDLEVEADARAANKERRSNNSLVVVAANRPLDLTRKQIRIILDHLDGEEWCEPRPGWLKVGMALNHQYQGDADGLDLWNRFSGSSDKFDAEDSERTWESFRSRANPLTMATLLDAARRSRDWSEESYQAAGRAASSERQAMKSSSELQIFWGEEDDGIDGLEPLIDGFLFQHSVSAIYGKYGEGKSFVAIDIALSVATGLPWMGHSVSQGAVLYFAAEGYIGMKQRREAWCKHKRIARAPEHFALARGTINLQKPDGVTLEALAAAAKSKKAKLIVLDTLNAVFGGADENDSASMSKARHELERLRDLSGAAVLVVHHAGKDVDRGLRGSSVLGGAMDTILLVDKRQIISKAPKGKQKDMEPSSDLDFCLTSVSLPNDKKGRARSSLVLEASNIKRFPDLSGQEAVAYRALLRAEGFAELLGYEVASVAEWRRCFGRQSEIAKLSADARKKAFQRAKDKLEAAGRIRVLGENVERRAD